MNRLWYETWFVFSSCLFTDCSKERLSYEDCVTAVTGDCSLLSPAWSWTWNCSTSVTPATTMLWQCCHASHSQLKQSVIMVLIMVTGQHRVTTGVTHQRQQWTSSLNEIPDKPCPLFLYEIVNMKNVRTRTLQCYVLVENSLNFTIIKIIDGLSY